MRKLSAHNNSVIGVAISFENVVASCSEDSSIIVWNSESDQPVHVLTKHSHYVQCVNFAPDGK